MTSRQLPAWRRSTAGAHRWPAAVTVAAVIGLQMVLPDQLVVQPHWLLPALSALLLVTLVLLGPGRAGTEHRHARKVALGLLLVVSAGNAGSAVRLVDGIVNGSVADQAGPLLAAGATIYLTNIVVFSLWYWEFDRGGPTARAAGTAVHPDLLFPQMANPEFAPAEWEPGYVDYLYLAFTNATAFSPTDVMPLKIWAKLTMLLQSVVSLVLVTLVVARAVNILR
ncbi:DUF1345 domain-containing protein [Amycolatopsis acidiphila]|uniref:DUF1345 domain-containing protein n=2 Tax=Amycolatopsis acidiphila TaxID=715473 RepID=A0A558AKQ3_9PSEU|nr:DUF1345 domain-containing protein [Amycolatopsis acidiphila]TVT24837.1 DUF1345 domain-containing protein [Amycolatopsis acidiphila]UIJ63846.1 DUF1345 domain-containing protein [Amycolatopsis acidiphila]